jgi:uncharacterized membrane protein
LYLTVGYTIVMFLVLGVLRTGDLFAILLVLFVPGYVLVAALFPRKADLNWIERIALSFGLSIAIVASVGLFLNFTPWGIRLVPVVATLGLFTVGVGSAAYRRRIRLPPEARLSASLELRVPEWHLYGRFDRAFTVILAASLVVAAVTLAYVLLTANQAERFTDFYILGPGGTATGYPTTLNISQPGSVILGIVNHEFTTIDYTIRVDLARVRLVYNFTVGRNETVEVSRTTWSWINITRAAGQSWNGPYVFSISSAGSWKLHFSLYKDQVLTSQELHLSVRVS